MRDTAEIVKDVMQCFKCGFGYHVQEPEELEKRIAAAIQEARNEALEQFADEIGKLIGCTCKQDFGPHAINCLAGIALERCRHLKVREEEGKA